MLSEEEDVRTSLLRDSTDKLRSQFESLIIESLIEFTKKDKTINLATSALFVKSTSEMVESVRNDLMKVLKQTSDLKANTNASTF